MGEVKPSHSEPLAAAPSPPEQGRSRCPAGAGLNQAQAAWRLPSALARLRAAGLEPLRSAGFSSRTMREPSVIPQGRT